MSFDFFIFIIFMKSSFVIFSTFHFSISSCAFDSRISLKISSTSAQESQLDKLASSFVSISLNAFFAFFDVLEYLSKYNLYISFNQFSSGLLIFIIFEILHERITAGSISSNRFVVQIIKILLESSIHHISLKNVFTIFLSSS